MFSSTELRKVAIRLPQVATMGCGRGRRAQASGLRAGRGVSVLSRRSRRHAPSKGAPTGLSARPAPLARTGAGFPEVVSRLGPAANDKMLWLPESGG
jgi:hypothetical protein